MKLPAIARRGAGVGIVAAAYVYFLIFAEFAFLRLAQAHGSGGTALRFVMGCMAFAGVAASLWTGRVFTPERAGRWLSAGFGGCALAGLLALGARNSVAFAGAAALIGGSLGVLTVSLVGNLPRFFPVNHRGACIGLGTGLAYAVCNVPAVFAGSAAVQTWVAVAVCLAGVAASLLAGRSAGGFETAEPARTSTRTPAPSPALPPARVEQGADGKTGPAFRPLVVIFLTLIWLDSAAFYILQNTPALNQFGWTGTTLQWSNAAIHFAVACAAGVWLDRGGLTRVLLLAFGCLAGAAVCVSSEGPAVHWTNWLYTAGVSLYSTALVFTPLLGIGAKAGNNDADAASAPAARRAGTLYAVAGWAGSALGIGMAQDLHAIPLWFVGVAAVVFGCSWVWARRGLGRDIRRRMAAAVGGAALVFVVAHTSSSRARLQAPGPPDAEPSAALGREVYISEGCIHCHSQYVRPGTLDETWWGPAADPGRVLAEAPPLIGNRRQGPDLMNVGNRRAPAWNRLHLQDPRALSPHSRMPSYAYLFRAGDARGEALLAYLADRGGDTFAQRGDLRRAWRPDPAAVPLEPPARARLFRESCAQCHGEHGGGNGVLASQIGPRKPRDLTRAQWQFIPARGTPAERRVELARVIKFGIPGTSMSGHETLDDSQVLGLAAHVETLYISPVTTP